MQRIFQKWPILLLLTLTVFFVLPVKYTIDKPECSSSLVLASNPPQCPEKFIYHKTIHYGPIPKFIAETRTQKWDWMEPPMPTFVKIDYPSIILAAMGAISITTLIKLALAPRNKN